MKLSTPAAATLYLAALGSTCVLPEENASLRPIEAEQMMIRRQVVSNSTGLAIGKGDRFDGGNKFPRGLGSQPNGTQLGEILSLKEMESAFKGLVKEYGLETFTAPHKTFEGRTVYGGKVGGSKCRDKHAVYFNAALQ
jgi:hypothetical protein